VDPRNSADDLKPKDSALPKFESEGLETENDNSGPGEARGTHWWIGLVAGISVTAMPFFNSPADSDSVVFNWPPSPGGIAASIVGFGLAVLSLFMIRRASIREPRD
jgi:hypothetical protein